MKQKITSSKSLSIFKKLAKIDEDLINFNL